MSVSVPKSLLLHLPNLHVCSKHQTIVWLLPRNSLPQKMLSVKKNYYVYAISFHVNNMSGVNKLLLVRHRILIALELAKDIK